MGVTCLFDSQNITCYRFDMSMTVNLPVQANGREGLKEILAPLDPKQRVYILFRICDMDMTSALKQSKAKLASYNKWCNQEDFVSINRRVRELNGLYKEEAMQLLRRRNQSLAVIAEQMAMEKIIRELASGQFNLLKTRFGNMVYTKLLTDLDINPQVNLSWAERWTRIQDAIGGSNGTNAQLETDIIIPPECTAGDSVPLRQQDFVEAEA